MVPAVVDKRDGPIPARFALWQNRNMYPRAAAVRLSPEGTLQ